MKYCFCIDNPKQLLLALQTCNQRAEIMKFVLNRATMTMTMTHLKNAATVKKSWFGFGIVELGKSVEIAANSLSASFDRFTIVFFVAVVILSGAIVVSAPNRSAAPKRTQE